MKTRIQLIAVSNGIHVVHLGPERGDFRLITVWPHSVKLSMGVQS